MSILRVGLLQLLDGGSDQEANLAIGEAACRRAAELGADIVLFPEMWNIGYMPYMDDEDESTNFWRDPACLPPPYVLDSELLETRTRWQAQAIDREGPFITHFRALARELGIAIAITYLERWPGAPRNTMSLIDRHGEIVLTYAKVHTCDFGMEDALTPGNGFPVCTLDTMAGPVRIGAMICYDREFPESARVLMLGRDRVIQPSCGPVPRKGYTWRPSIWTNCATGVGVRPGATPSDAQPVISRWWLLRWRIPLSASMPLGNGTIMLDGRVGISTGICNAPKFRALILQERMNHHERTGNRHSPGPRGRAGGANLESGRALS